MELRAGTPDKAKKRKPDDRDRQKTRDGEPTIEERIDRKLVEAEIPGREVEFDPDEAERIAFREDALPTKTRGKAPRICNARRKTQGGR